MNEEPNPGTVTFTVKELLARIDVKIDALTLSIEKKASQASVDALAKRLEIVESDVASLKSSRSQLLAIVAAVSFVVPLAVAALLHYV